MYMNTFQNATTIFSEKKREIAFLSVIWIFGILSGIVIVVLDKGIYIIANSAMKLQPDIILLYIVNLLPILILLILFAARAYGLVYLISFLYGVLRGYCGMCTVLAFGGGGWLVRLLFLFSSGLISALYWWLIFSVKQFNRYLLKLCCTAVLFVSFVTLLDYFVISPFLCGIL